MREGSRVERREERDGGKEASAVDDVDSVFCAGGKSALIVGLGDLGADGNVIGACIGESWEGRRRGGLVPPSVGREMREIRVCEEKTRGRARRCGQCCWWFWTLGIVQAKKEESGKQLRDKFGREKGNCKAGVMEESKEGRNWRDEIRVGDDEETICLSCARVSKTLRVF